MLARICGLISITCLVHREWSHVSNELAKTSSEGYHERKNNHGQTKSIKQGNEAVQDSTDRQAGGTIVRS